MGDSRDRNNVFNAQFGLGRIRHHVLRPPLTFASTSGGRVPATGQFGAVSVIRMETKRVSSTFTS